MQVFVGVDVGGTKIAAGVVDRQGQIHGRTQHPTDVSSPEMTLRGTAHAVESTIRISGYDRSSILAVGLGIPGKVDPDKGIGITSVNLDWRDVAVRSILEDHIEIPCFIENDVKAATLGELHYGVGQSVRNFVYLGVGTGIAAGVIIERELYRGSTGMAGEIGHAIVEPNGPRCKCGMRGCLEAVAAGPAIAAQANAALRAGANTILKEMAAQNEGVISTEMVFQAAAQGDGVALLCMEEAGRYLGLAIFTLIMHYDPQAIVLGGGVSNAGELILDPIRRELERQATWSFAAREVLNPEIIRISSLGLDVAILGAAVVGEQGINRSPSASRHRLVRKE